MLRLKQFKDLTLVYQADHAAGLSVTPSVEYPAGTWTDKTPIIFPQASSQRVEHTRPLVDGSNHLEGLQIKFKIASSGKVRLFSGVARARPIGVYFDGANSETWETEPMTLATQERRLYASLLRFVEFEYSATAEATLDVYTDLPSWGRREFHPLPAASRQRYRVTLLGTTKARLLQIVVRSLTGKVRLYGGRVYLKPMGTGGGDWTWLTLPIPPTPDAWGEARLPIVSTGEDWAAIALPIPETPAGWGEFALPIPPTPEDWGAIALPIPPTPEDWGAIALPIPETPEGWAEMALPIRPTSEEWGELALPFDETPDRLVWADVPVDQ